jgi:glycosyltransferase involved in cell wall biosynthesis
MIIGYLGTLGMSHKLDFILKSAAQIQDPKIHIVIIGEGAEKDSLIRLKNELNLKNVSMLNGVKKEEVPNYLSIFDMALVNLRKTKLFLGALPSKIFENAAMGIPILLGLQGEAKEVIEKYSAGLAFEPENSEDFILKIDMFAKDQSLRKHCKEGCIKLAQAYDRKKIAKEMLEYILNVK